MLDAGEVALEFGEQRRFGAALQHLAQEARRPGSTSRAKCGGRLGERHDAQMIGLAMAGRVRRHVGEHDVGLAAEHGLEPLRRGFVEEIELQELDAGDRLHVENVERDHAAVRADALAPRFRSSRRAPRRDRRHARPA